MKTNRPNLRIGKWIFRAVVLGLLFTGLGQMPIFKRYYLADIPGLGWSADYYLTHRIHYALAAVLLVWLFFRFARHFMGRIKRDIPPAGVWPVIRALLWTAILGTGLARVAKNSPDIFFSPITTMLVDWTHLGFVLVLGLAAMTARLGSKAGAAFRS